MATVWVICYDVPMAEWDGQPVRRYLAAGRGRRTPSSHSTRQPPGWTWAPTRGVYAFARRAKALRVIKELEAAGYKGLEASEQDAETWAAVVALVGSTPP